MNGGMSTELWPALRVADWADTRDTLHMWTQIVGKIRMASEPMINHWWQVPLYVSARGLTTSSMPYAQGAFDMEFDFVEHRLDLRASTGGQRSVPLASRPVADFYAETMAALGELGVDVTIRTTPTEVVRAIPFEKDHEHTTYDAGPRAGVLGPARQRPAGAHRVPLALHRQGQPGPLLLGRAGHGVHAVLRPHRTAAPRRRPELRGLGHGRGLLARAQQRRLLAGLRRGGRLLRLRLPGAARVP